VLTAVAVREGVLGAVFVARGVLVLPPPPPPGVRVERAVFVASGVDVFVAVFVATDVLVAVAVFVGTDVFVAVAVFVGCGVFVAVTTAVFVTVTVRVVTTEVRVTCAVCVPCTVWVACTVCVTCGVSWPPCDVGVDVGVCVLVGTDVLVAVGVSVATGTSDVLVAVGVLVAAVTDVFVAVGVLVAAAVVLVAVAVGVGVTVTNASCVGVDVGVLVPKTVFVAVGVFVIVGVFVAAEPITIVASKHGSVSDSRPQSTYGVPKESPTETDWMRIRPSLPSVVLYVIDATGRNVPSASAVVVPVDSKHDRNELATLADASLSLLGAGGEQAHVPSAPTVASRKFGFAFLSASVPTGGLSMVCGVAIASKLKAPMSVSNPRLLPMTTFTVTVVVPDGNVQASWMPAVTVSQSMAM
jgi:hypothetical protein